MPRTAKVVSVSFLSKEQHRDAVRKSKQRKRSLSAQIQHHFKTLPDLDPEHA